jgi:hypothetical protein
MILRHVGKYLASQRHSCLWFAVHTELSHVCRSPDSRCRKCQIMWVPDRGQVHVPLLGWRHVVLITVLCGQRDMLITEYCVGKRRCWLQSIVWAKGHVDNGVLCGQREMLITEYCVGKWTCNNRVLCGQKEMLITEYCVGNWTCNNRVLWGQRKMLITEYCVGKGTCW